MSRQQERGMEMKQSSSQSFFVDKAVIEGKGELRR